MNEICRRLEGQMALVTGASRGIGRSIAMRLAQEGAHVLVHFGTRQDEAEQVVRHITEHGGQAQAIGADLRTLDGIHALFAQVDDAVRKHGRDGSLDILVNNAGIGQILGLEETTEASFDEVMNINVKAPCLSASRPFRVCGMAGESLIFLLLLHEWLPRACSPIA